MTDREFKRITKQQIQTMFYGTPLTRTDSYNQVKHIVANISIYANTEEELVLPSSRAIAEQIHYSKTVVGKHILRLESEKYIKKLQWGESPRECMYIVTMSEDDAKRFKKYYLLPPSKKRKFDTWQRHIAKAGQRAIEKEGTNEWLDTVV